MMKGVLAKVKGDEGRLNVHVAVQNAYGFDDDEVQFLWFLWMERFEVETEDELEPEDARTVRRHLIEKLCIKERDGGDGKYHDDMNHSMAIRSYRRRRLMDFASWLFTGEPLSLPSVVPNVIQCMPFPDGCGRVFEKAMFPFWPTDGRCGLCIQRCCHPTLGSKPRAVAVRKLHGMLDLRKSKQIDKDLTRFARVFSRFIQKEGDIEGVADSWHQWFEFMRSDESKRASATLGNAYLAIMKIWLELDKHRDSQANLEDMDDEQLKDFIVQHTLSRLTQDQVEQFITAATDQVGDILADGLEEEIYAEATVAR